MLKDVWGKTWDLSAEVRAGPVVIVFYLGSTCMACVTHLTELDVAISRFRTRGVLVLAVSGDTPEFSLERIRKYGDFQIPLLSDAGRAARRPTASGRRAQALARTAERRSTALSSSTAMAWCAGPTSAIARSQTSKRC